VLVQVAHQLLLWWLDAHTLCLSDPGRTALLNAESTKTGGGHYAYHVQAVELAAALAQSAGHGCTPEQFRVLIQVRQALWQISAWRHLRQGLHRLPHCKLGRRPTFFRCLVRGGSNICSTQIPHPNTLAGQ
jgi:hypothetical protein